MKCSCGRHKRKVILDGTTTFPRMVWFAEDSLFNGAIIAKNYNDFLFLVDELAYAVARLDKE